MPFLKLNFKPGVNRDQTNYSNEGGWYSCDKVRFYSGYPQKIGGWAKTTTNTILGTCRQMWGWITTYADNFLALGTNKKVYIEVGGEFYDITPLRETDPTFTSPATDNCFTTTNGSSVITVIISSSTAIEGNYVDFTGANAIGTITAAMLNTTHEIQTVINTSAFTIDVGTAANTTGTGGGTTINASFEINTGFPITTAGYGWGTGSWGTAAWGLASSSPVYLQQQDWWFDNFDNDLVMNIRNGPVYYWERGSSLASVALGQRAILLGDVSGAADVPDEVMQILVSQNDKHLLAFGATPYGGGDFDPLLIRWASQDDPGMWTPLATNSAGFLRVSRGSEIVRAIPTRQEILVFTNTHLYSLQFLGTSDVFGLQELGDNISIISPRSPIAVNNVTYWMGHDKFYAYSGRVETLPCTLRNHVFQNLNYNQTDQIICGANEGYNEIWWFYPTQNSDYNDAYVIYNYLERLWYYGTIERTAWLDSPLREYPQAIYTANSTTNGVGYLIDQENGVDADGVAIESYIQSSDFDIGDGEKFMLSKRMIPDVNFSGSTATTPEVTFTIRPRTFPGAAYSGDAADAQPVIETSVDIYTEQVFIRARARQMALRIGSDGLGTQWQLGSPRLDVKEDGKR